jgi:hypothetical protein
VFLKIQVCPKVEYLNGFLYTFQSLIMHGGEVPL